MFDHDQFYNECNKRFKRRELLDNILFGIIVVCLGLFASFLLLAMLSPELYLCH